MDACSRLTYRGGAILVFLLGVCFQAAADEVDFAREIRPIFAQTCYDCHGPDDDDGGLQLSRSASVFGELPSGHVSVVPGEPDESEMLRRVTHPDPSERMPPRAEPLPDDQVDLLRRWIEQGAPWDYTHWAYSELEEPVVPAVEDADWPRNPIDRFVLAELEARSINPSSEADPPTLIRRLYLDLLGLPPTPEEVEAFVNDSRPDAWDRLVDRVLASPHFGERWGRHWLDKARFADSDGYLNDNERPDAWRYRDWVIDAINDDMPFDEFTVLQLAGDLLDDAGPMERLATAFHRQTLTNREAGVDTERYRVAEVFDRVETTSQIWLGLTANCARCHDHKYDDFAQSEYYQLFAFFNNADDATTRVPGNVSQQQAYQLALQEHEQELDRLRQAQRERLRELAEDEAGLAAWAEQLRQVLDDGDVGRRFEPANVIRKHVDTEVKLTQLEDESILAGDDRPARDKYMIDLHTERENVIGFRLEALPDDSLPGGGPGLGDEGAFVVTELRVFYKAGPDVSGGDRLSFASAEAIGRQDDHWPADAAIDGDTRSTGWGAGSGGGEAYEAIFLLDEPLPVDGLTSLRVVLDQLAGEGWTLGRFRVSYVTEPQVPELSDGAREALAHAPAEWPDAAREELLALRTEQDVQGRDIAGRIKELEESAPEPPMLNVRVMRERGEPRDTHIMEMGEYEMPGEQVYPGGLGVLHDLRTADADAGDGDGERLTRLDLAKWLVDDANALTPRVTANHIWLRLFGEGLVRTPDDFGVRGDMPTHPGLLDWLAYQYRDKDWSRKAMIRLIVSSATYRMASDHRSDLVEIDPTNRLLHRQNRFRVEAEIVRDLSLAAAGLLTPEIGGRSVFPPMQEDPTRARGYRWDTESDEQRYRRGMYTFFKRTAPFPNLVTFDCPDSTSSVVQRQRSNTPLQALTTLNNEVYIEAARAFGQRLHEGGAGDDAERLRRGFQVAISREPTDQELEALIELLQDSRAWYADEPEGAGQMIEGFASPDAEPAEQAAWVVVASTLLNVDEFLTRE